MQERKLDPAIESAMEEAGFVNAGTYEQGGEMYTEIELCPTPTGGDFLALVWHDNTAAGFAKGLKDFVRGYNVDDEVEMYVPMRGKGGCPSSIQALVDEMKWRKKSVRKLARQFA